MNPEFAGRGERLATDTWRRLIGLFGGDSVMRKFGKTVPAEWTSVLASLNDFQLERGMRRLIHSGRDSPPSLPAFIRLCRAVSGEDIEEGRPTVPALPNPDSWNGDDWDLMASAHLHAHITHRLHANPQCYGRPASVAVMQRSKEPAADASLDLNTAVAELVKAKNIWAAEMRDVAQNGPVPKALQDSIWREYIQAAEYRIAVAQARAAA